MLSLVSVLVLALVINTNSQNIDLVDNTYYLILKQQSRLCLSSNHWIEYHKVKLEPYNWTINLSDLRFTQIYNNLDSDHTTFSVQSFQNCLKSVIDLTETVYHFKQGNRYVKVISQNRIVALWQRQQQQLQIKELVFDIGIDYNRLLKQYSFVNEYAPVVYLSKDYLPINLYDYLDNMNFVNIEGSLYVQTKSDLMNCSSQLPFFNGSSYFQNITSYVFILPNNPSISYFELLNPANVTAYYQFFYPYNKGRFGWDNHVGDIEHVFIEFQNSKPFKLGLSQHNGGKVIRYDQLSSKNFEPDLIQPQPQPQTQTYHDNQQQQQENKHIVIYSAHGSHCSYLSQGTHSLVLDKCSDDIRWPYYNNLKLLLPFTFSQPSYKNISIFTQIQYFGNHRSTLQPKQPKNRQNVVASIFNGLRNIIKPNNIMNIVRITGMKHFMTGPKGMLDKKDLRWKLDKMD